MAIPCRRLVLLCILCLSMVQCLCAQNIGEWRVYPSYYVATQNAVVGGQVYGLMDGNLLRYSVADGELKTYDRLHDLSDVHIRHIVYSEEAKRLLLVYDNGNLDLLDADDRVWNLKDYKDKAMAGKEVTQVFVKGRLAYLATGFGFLVIDMQEGVIRDTYQLGKALTDVLVTDKDEIWVCGDLGVYSSALNNPNLHNLQSWTQRHSAVNWKEMVAYKDEVYVRHTSGIYRFTTTSANTFQRGSFDRLGRWPDGTMWASNAQELYLYPPTGAVRHLQQANAWRDIQQGSKGLYWVSDGSKGLVAYQLTEEGMTSTQLVVQPNSPKHDYFGRMTYVQDRLLVAGGSNTTNDVQKDATAMYYEDDKWTILDESAAASLLPGVKQYNTTELLQDPDDPTHHFAGTARNGLKEYRGGKLVQIYHGDNSPIQSILPDDAHYHQYETATAATYDRSGNLWIANQNTDTVMRYRTPAGKWGKLYYEDIKNLKYAAGYLFTASGVNFLLCQAWPTAGVYAFDTQGTLTNLRDDRHKLLTTITNQDETSYQPQTVNCMVEDMEGRIWCGMGAGLFVIDDPATFFDDDFRFTQVKIARNDGSGLADYLLNGVPIQCIAVDGGNRKWIGTESNGLYLISPDGTELIQHFTTDNSPLLDNEIQSLALHAGTGRLMIGTAKGLCSYQSDATLPNPTLEKEQVTVFPNPVRADYTGPIRIEGLTMNAEVKVCTTTGQLVWSGVSQGGTCVWNGLDQRGRRVASGIYHIVANTEAGDKAVVARVILIR